MKKTSFSRQLGLVTLSVIGLLIGLSTQAQAQYAPNQYGNNGYSYQQNGYGYQTSASQIAISNGYELGYGAGSDDRSFGSSYQIDRHKSFRDGDSGYHSQNGLNRDNYKQEFRQGFEQGYSDGYNGNRNRITGAGGNTYYNNRGNQNYNNRGNQTYRGYNNRQGRACPTAPRRDYRYFSR